MPFCLCPPKVTPMKAGMCLSWPARNCWMVEFISAWNKTPIFPPFLPGSWLYLAEERQGKGTVWNCSKDLSRLNLILDTNVQEKSPLAPARGSLRRKVMLHWKACWSQPVPADNDKVQEEGAVGWAQGGMLFPRMLPKTLPSSTVHGVTEGKNLRAAWVPAWR